MGDTAPSTTEKEKDLGVYGVTVPVKIKFIPPAADKLIRLSSTVYRFRGQNPRQTITLGSRNYPQKRQHNLSVSLVESGCASPAWKCSRAWAVLFSMGGINEC